MNALIQEFLREKRDEGGVNSVIFSLRRFWSRKAFCASFADGFFFCYNKPSILYQKFFLEDLPSEETPEERMSKKYEACVLIVPDLAPEALELELAEVEKVMVDAGASVAQKDVWTKRQLAYPIKKKTEGVYAIFYVEAEKTAVKKITDTLRMRNNLLRFLIISKKKFPKPSPVSSEPEASVAEVSDGRSDS